jgi:hypothetical protein
MLIRIWLTTASMNKCLPLHYRLNFTAVQAYSFDIKDCTSTTTSKDQVRTTTTAEDAANRIQVRLS